MNKRVIHGDMGRHRIHRNIYGHFAEHLGTCIYGGFWVGGDSPIPNVRGIRTAAVEALKAARIPVLRWPGGCFADEYHWMNGIGPVDQRPCHLNTHWGGVTENNHFGTHEFMDLCAQLGCEPYICGNVGSGAVQEIQQWVDYLTFNGESPMSRLRRSNGREEPWKVTYWGVGNENWGCGGNMRPEYYADVFRRYATFLHDYGENRLFKIACGASDADYTWTEVLMREAGRFMHGLSLHYYTVPGTWQNKGSATDFGEEEWFTTLRKALWMEELVGRHATVMDRHDPEKRVALIVDEWGTWYDPEPGTNPHFNFQQNTLRDALVAALTLNVFNNHCDRVRMANLAQTVNVLQAPILTEGGKLVLTPTYHVFEMYSVHQDAVQLPVTVQSDLYRIGEEEIPAVRCSASMDAGSRIHLSICHTNPAAEDEVAATLRGFRPRSVSGRILTAERMNACNSFEEPDAVRPESFDEASLRGDALHVKLPPMSVVVLEIT